MKLTVFKILCLKSGNQFLALIVSIMIARAFGEHSLGEFALFNAMLSLFIVLVSFGSNVFLQKELSGEYCTSKIFGIFWSVIWFRTVNFFFVVLVLFVVYSVVDIACLLEIFCFIVILFLMQNFSFIAFFLRSKNYFLLAELCEWSFFRLSVLVGLALAALIGKVYAIYLTIALTLFIFICFTIMYLKKEFKKTILSPDFSYRFSTQDYFGLIRLSSPFFITQITGIVFMYTDTISLSIFESLESLAIYDVSYKLAAVVLFLNSAISAVLGTKIRENYRNGYHNKSKSLIFFVVCFSLLVSFALLLLSYFFADKILLLWGPNFLSGKLLLLILLFGTLVQFSFSSVSIYLLMTERASLCANISVIFSIFNLLTTPVCTYFYGATGAALTTTLTLTGIAIVSFYFYCRNI